MGSGGAHERVTLVGREAEFQLLGDLLPRARNGDSVTLAIVGEPGSDALRGFLGSVIGGHRFRRR